LKEPFAKRTVEGDLGLFHNLDTLAALVPSEGADALNALRERFSVPEGDDLTRYQLALSRAAVKTAVERHAGHVAPVMTANGEVWVQRGKDLGNVKLVLGAGGPIAFSSNSRFVLEGAAASSDAPEILAPRAPKYLLDAEYILFAVGLLSRTEPDKALRIVKKYLREI
jgi:uncharacterized protein (TIGR01319 family)